MSNMGPLWVQGDLLYKKKEKEKTALVQNFLWIQIAFPALYINTAGVGKQPASLHWGGEGKKHSITHLRQDNAGSLHRHTQSGEVLSHQIKKQNITQPHWQLC